MKTCVQCRTENGSDYKYCKFCGAELPCVDRKPFEENTDARQQGTGGEYADSPVSDDVTVTEMNIFVGKNNDKIVPKFISMQQKFKKTSWCWPVFLLGILFGYAGMAAWFFYRKMYKPALLLLAFGTVINIADIAVNFNSMVDLYGGFFDVLASYGQMLSQDAANAVDWFTDSVNRLALQYSENSIGIFSLINEYVGGYILPVVLGLFGMHIYKKHSLGKIADIKRVYAASPAYRTVLYQKGGTSAVPAVIGWIVYTAVSTVSVMIPMISAIASGSASLIGG